MSNELSINAEKNEIDLENNKSDYTTAAIKAAVGNVPIVGSILTEVVGVVIPNQKSDRVKLFVEILAEKVKHIEKNVLETKMKTEEFTDLFEDALPRAARALTDERREYIATFLKNSLDNEQLDHIGEKKLLSILNELNDVEIIFLKHKALRNYQKQAEFYELHKNVLDMKPVYEDSPQEDADKMYLYESYRTKLQDLGLTKPVFESLRDNEPLPLDPKTGKLKVSFEDASELGRLFLKYIDDTFIDDKY